MDLNGFAVTTVATTTVGKIDGIDDDGLGHYYISSWSPMRISRYDTSFAGPALTITAPGINNPADICYAKGIDTLGIPNGNGPVSFIGFGPTVGVQPSMDVAAGFTVYPHPASDASMISFEIANAGPVQLEIIDLQGRLVHALLQEEMPAGQHRVLLSGLVLRAGIYVLHLQAQADQVDVAHKLIME